MFLIRLSVLVFVVMSIFLGLLFLGLSLKSRREKQGYQSCSSFDDGSSACHNCASSNKNSCGR